VASGFSRTLEEIDMTRVRTIAVMAFLVLSTGSILADVRADEKTRIEFAGALGRVVNLFGGKAAREGITSMVAVKGDRKATLNDTTGQIIDLGEEKIYDLDLKRKTYKVTTFAELRRRMEDAKTKAEQNAKAQPADRTQPADKPEPPRDQKNLEIDFDVKDTGQRKSLNGFDTHEAIMTIVVREKGRKLEQSGGMVLTSDMWLTPKIAAMSEVVDFDVRYAKKLYGPVLAGVSAEEMSTALAMYPTLAPAMEKMRNEGVKLAGTAILTTVTFEGVKSDEEFAAEQKQREDDNKNAPPVRGFGGLASALAKKAAQKKFEGDPTARTTVMTSTTEILKVITDVSATDVAVPAGFKENK
jgi:hypothetical protein